MSADHSHGMSGEHSHVTSAGDPHGHERALPPSGHATVVLDIGDGVGALVVHTAAALAGVEIELAQRGETSVFVHTEVRERCLPDGSVFAGVFPALPVGDYTLLGTGDRDVCNVTISEGGVTEVHW
jgi:hypothetical protein